MSLPGFTAEASLAQTKSYATPAAPPPAGDAVVPQLVLSPWTPCSYLFFRCTEFGDIAACRRWRLVCVPE